MRRTVTPNNCGTDLSNKSKRYDASVRVERGHIVIDLFDSERDDPAAAHLTSEEFPNTESGAKKATKFLHGEGFQVKLTKGKHKKC